MVQIEIDDEVWELFKASWALMGIRTHDELVRMLEVEMWENSSIVLDDAEVHLMDDTPEAYVRREIGLERERKENVSSNRPIHET